MRILLCGANGFMGRQLARLLQERGHVVVRGVRTPKGADEIAVDFRQDVEAATWLPRLAGIDAVLNAVGVLVEAQPGDFERINHRVPAALAAAAATAGIRHFVHISSLGECATPYLDSKRAGDAGVLGALPAATVIRAGLVFGESGEGTRLFLVMASLPLLGCPSGAGPVQPVHIDDLCALAVTCLEQPGAGGVVDLPGPRRLSYREWLATYRAGLGMGRGLAFPLPDWLMSLTCALLGRVPGSVVNQETWKLLRAGNFGDAGQAAARLGRPLRDPAQFIEPQRAPALRAAAVAAWRRPALWLLTAIMALLGVAAILIA